MTQKRFQLTKLEETNLERIQERANDTVCKLLATKMYREHMDVHRGAIWIDDEIPEAEGECLIFGNDSYKNDVRARKEVAQVIRRLDGLGIRNFGFGLGPDGYTWALRADSDDDYLMDLIVWDVWFSITCPKANPVRQELNEYLEESGYVAA